MSSSSRQNRDECVQAVAAGLLGSAVGDALGVPVEFKNRKALHQDPVVGMRGYGAHFQPAGTWSDDTSLTLCLVESLIEAGVDYSDQAARFVGWMCHAEWTPHGVVFDIGKATREAIVRLADGVSPIDAGPLGELDCGNGSLMRLAPLGMYLALASESERAQAAANCSRLTHGHPRCQLACIMLTEIIASLVKGCSIEQAIGDGQAVLQRVLISEFPTEARNFVRLLAPSVATLEEEGISSTGYVIHCLEASLWCALRAETFREGVLMAVNLGDDTDTTGAVAGALLGLRFGLAEIPQEWIDALARRSAIQSLVARFQDACQREWAKA